MTQGGNSDENISGYCAGFLDFDCHRGCVFSHNFSGVGDYHSGRMAAEFRILVDCTNCRSPFPLLGNRSALPMSVIDYTWEYKSFGLTNESYWSGGHRYDKLEVKLNELGAGGWEVFSVIIPDPQNYSTYRITAKRRTGAKYLEKTT